MAVELKITAVTEEELLRKVKDLNDYGEYDLDDNKLTALIDDAKNHLRSADIAEVLINSNVAVVVIADMVDSISRKEGISEFALGKISQLKVVSYRYE